MFKKVFEGKKNAMSYSKYASILLVMATVVVVSTGCGEAAQSPNIGLSEKQEKDEQINVMQENQTQEKWLSVVLNYEKGVLFIQIQNSYHIVRKDADGNYLTTKQETQNHGIGLKNVRRIVNQNHGTMQITDSDRIFDVKVMLYV